MANLNILEQLRTRKEVEDYFKQLGKEITEEELDALKQSYEKAQENNEALNMQQLDNVAGGWTFVKVEFFTTISSQGYPWDELKSRISTAIDLVCNDTCLNSNVFKYYSIGHDKADHIFVLNDESEELTFTRLKAYLPFIHDEKSGLSYFDNTTVHLKWPSNDGGEVTGSLAEWLKCKDPINLVSNDGTRHGWNYMSGDETINVAKREKTALGHYMELHCTTFGTGFITKEESEARDNERKKVQKIIKKIDKYLEEEESLTAFACFFLYIENHA